MSKSLNLLGQIFGNLTVLSRAPSPNHRKRTYWYCKCVCGNEKVILGSNLKRGNSTSCGCVFRNSTKYNFVDLKGQRFGHLLVLERASGLSPSRGALWTCQCDCGFIKKVASNSLTSLNTTSCGKKLHRSVSNKVGEISLTHLNQLKQNAIHRNLVFSVSPEYLWNLFLQQDRKCALSGVELTFTQESNIIASNSQNTTASLDRIDNSKAYIEGNVRWVHKKLNIMRGAQSDTEFLNWCWQCILYRNNNMFSNKWDSRFLNLATLISSHSKDPSTKVGAVIVDAKKRIISSGYNGFPTGIQDHMSDLLNRDVKYLKTIHAEINAILFANTNLSDTIIYISPLPPCTRCSGAIIQTGIKRVVSYNDNIDNPRWKDEFALGSRMFKESGVILDLYKKNEIL